MLKKTALDHFGGSAAQVAKAIKRTTQAVNDWPDVVPEGMAYKLQVVTGGKIQVDAALYEKPAPQAATKT